MGCFIFVKEREIQIFEKACILGITVIISLIICDYFKLSKFYTGIAALNVINLNDAKTMRQAYERIATTFIGGILACAIAYVGYQQNILAYVLGLGIVSLIAGFFVHIQATVGCIAFTYIMLNINPRKIPIEYFKDRFFATVIGAISVFLIVTCYNRIRNKTKEEYNGSKAKIPFINHVYRGILPGLAIAIGYIFINYLTKYISSKYVTNYILYYCALAAIVPFNIDVNELFNKTRERLMSTILGGAMALFFTYLGLTHLYFVGFGIFLVVFLIEPIFSISASVGGIAFLFIMVNLKNGLTPIVYYTNRVMGTVIGIVMIIIVTYLFGKIREILISNSKKFKTK